MTRYTIEKKMPSCIVDLKLIREIEKYLTNRLAKQLESILGNEEYDKFKYTLSIVNVYGTEVFSTIDDYHLEQFPNQIKRIVINFKKTFSDFDLRLSLSKDPIYTDIHIDSLMDNAKEIAHGIIHEIENMLNQNKSVHYLFYGKYAGFIYFLFMICLSFSFVLLPRVSDTIVKIWVFIMLVGICFYPMRLISPYIEFDTKRNNKINSRIKWVVNGLAGVFVFGLIATYLRNLIFKL